MNNEIPQPEGYVTIKYLRNYYQAGHTTIYDWIRNYGFPKPYKIGGRLARWKMSECVEWEKNNRSGGAA